MLDPIALRQKMAIPPSLKDAYLRIVAAGMKVMFSDKTRGLMQQQLEASPDMVKNLSDGIAGLMAILYKQSKGMPKQLIIPAALELLAHAIELVTKTKIASLTPEQIGQAIQATVNAVLAKFGMSPEQAQAALQQMAGKNGTPAQAAPRGIIQGAA